MSSVGFFFFRIKGLYCFYGLFVFDFGVVSWGYFADTARGLLLCCFEWLRAGMGGIPLPKGFLVL